MKNNVLIFCAKGQSFIKRKEKTGGKQEKYRISIFCSINKRLMSTIWRILFLKFKAKTFCGQDKFYRNSSNHQSSSLILLKLQSLTFLKPYLELIKKKPPLFCMLITFGFLTTICTFWPCQGLWREQTLWKELRIQGLSASKLRQFLHFF